MTVRESTNTPHYIGLSSDSKPTGVQIGSTFWEYDTGDLYTTYDGTHWAPYPKDIV